MDMAKVRLYRDLRTEQARLGAEADGIKEEADKLEKELIELFAEEGVPNVRVDDETVALRRDVYAQKEQGVATDDLVEALRNAGLGDMVSETCNMNTLSAFVRELEEKEEPLPASLVGVLKSAEVFRVRVTKARATKASAAINKKKG